MLDASKQLVSDLWLDQPDAHDRIDERAARGELSADEAARLHQFVDEGYTTMSIGIDDAFCDAFEGDVAQAWQQRPVDLAVSPLVGRPLSFHDYDGEAREPGYRIPDFHGHSPSARDLYLDADIFRMVELILGQDAVAFQSLYFEYGSAQGLHRDPMFVAANPAAHLVASWIALEDIAPDSGPLSYVPGSHRLPWFEFAPGSIVATNDTNQRLECRGQIFRAIAERGLEAKPFTCRRGDVFLWHAGLVHGGMPIDNRAHTRKSFVTHYSSAANYTTRRASMLVRKGDGWKNVTRTTDHVLSRPTSRGLDSPLRGLELQPTSSRRTADANTPQGAQRSGLQRRLAKLLRGGSRSAKR
jgi:hypothetical protein